MTLTFATEHALTTDKDISSITFWEKSFTERDKTFAWLRAHAPVSWHLPFEDPMLPPEVHKQAGFWAITTAADIRRASLDNETFSSELGGVGLRPMHPELKQPPTFLEMDPPDHTRYRRIMSAAFTPKAVRRLNDQIVQRAGQIVDAVVGAGEIDFVTQVAAKLPMLTVADMVGVPESLVESFAHAGDNALGAHDPAIIPPGMNHIEFMLAQHRTLRDIGVDLVEHRRKHPADDIATALAHAEFDGKQISAEQISSVMLLLSIAGNDTTKQTTNSTVLAFDRNPEQRDWLLEDFDGRIMGAIEEFVRYAAPVMDFARTATRDVELGGEQIAAGDKVVLFYCSGNRDESAFREPHTFDLSRGRTEHVGFGGGGIHFCLGNGVAKVQLRALFSEILTKLPGLVVTGEPEYLRSEFIHGIRRLPVRTH